MDKTISISLGGFSFIVDDRAYIKLKNYLDDIRKSLHGMEGTDDIISDVEIRIAEIFREKLGAREVVGEQDVEHIIEVMGRPEQYVDEDAETNDNYSYKSNSSEKIKKKLYRDPNDTVIAGVLSGLAHYLGIEAWITRILWIVIFFSDVFISGASLTIISYIVLWIILPKAETATQKYEMYGQAGDFETIKKNASQAASEMKGVARDASSTLGNLFSVLGKIILICIGIMLICTGIGLIIGAIALLITSASEIPSEFFGYFVDYPWQDWSAKIMGLVLLTIPAILFILFGARLISRRVKISKYFVIGSSFVWFLAIVGSVVLVGTLFKNFTRNIEFSERKTYTVEADTLRIAFAEYKNFGERKIKWSIDDDMGGFVQFEGKLHRTIYDDIQIRNAENDQISVEVLYYSKGRSMDDARKNAEMIQYNYKVSPNGELTFDNFLTLPENSKFRDQMTKLIIYVPKGKTIYGVNVDDFIFSNEAGNYKNYEDGTNKYYKFVNNHFECLNCGWNSSDENLKVEFDSDSAGINISGDGIEIRDGEDQVIIKNNKIKISDGTDSVNVNISGD